MLRRHSPGARSLLVALALAAGPLPALRAAELTANAPITGVTVYRHRANVTRGATIELPAGSTRIVVAGLPDDLDTASARVTLGDPAIRLGSVSFETVNQAELVSAAERSAVARVQELEDRKSAIGDDIATAETTLKLLDSLAATPAGSAARPAIDGGSLAGVVTTLQGSGDAARARVRAARGRLRAVEAELAAAQADLKKIRTERKATYTAVVAVDSPRAIRTSLRLDYIIENAGWGWVYQARLDSDARVVALEKLAAVEQDTGEDWRGVALTLTTATPAEDAAPPDLGPLRLSLEPPPRTAAADEGRLQEVPIAVEDIVVTARKREERGPRLTEYVADYRVPGTVDLASGAEPRLFPLGSERIPVRLLARVVPNRNAAAYTVAQFDYAGDTPFQAGDLQLFRDGAFVGTAETRGFLPGQPVTLPFGSDERVQVAVQTEAAASRDKGLLSRQRVAETRQRFEITSFHGAPIRIEVIDRWPVASDAAIKVEALGDATPPDVRDVDGRPGVLQWNIEAEPRRQYVIRQYWSVTSPRDREVAADDESEY